MLMDALWLPVKEDLYLSLTKVCVESKDSSFSAALYAQLFVEMHMRTGGRCSPILKPRVGWLATLGVVLRSCAHARVMDVGL
ncbi:hypothetical protein ZIOFF_071148 [Zingiber officinale]|uniref:Uncharacterized protein n=1 Tax=Zingiber officinale TaxID=94328 RepID=A0A8J5C7W8_ZINOF|nr:hypothetical protein ZIOFF_071148 [Zingiber officinale]